MLWYDVRRSFLSTRMLIIILIALCCLYQPTIYLRMFEHHWIWENDLLTSLQDALGLGIFSLCMPATAAICAAALYVQDKRLGVFPFLIARVGRKRYVLSKVLCCGFSGTLSVSLPLLLFSFLQYSIYADFQSVPGDWTTILANTLTFAPVGFIWSVVGLSLSVWTDSAQVAYAAPFAIAMAMKVFSSSFGEWLDPYRQFSPIDTWMLDTHIIVAMQGGALLACLMLLYLGVRRCSE